MAPLPPTKEETMKCPRCGDTMNIFELTLITNKFGGSHRKTFSDTKEPIHVLRCNSCGAQGWAKKETEE